MRVTLDAGAAGHVTSEDKFPRVQVDRKTATKKFVAADGEQIRDLGEKIIQLKTNEGIHRCTTFRSASVVKPLISMQKVVRAGNTVVLEYSRCNGDQAGRAQRSVHDGHVDLSRRNRSRFKLAGTVIDQSAIVKPRRPA